MAEPVMFQGVAKDSPAFRLMTQMGWEEGKGLGKDKQGIKSHIRVRKPREEKSGVGVYEKEKAASNWTVNTHVFDNILKNLNLQVVNSNVTKVPKEELDETSDDEIAEVKEVKVKKLSRPQGRYKRREGGKLVRGYSETDLKAILGGQDDGVTVNTVKEVTTETDAKISNKPLEAGVVSTKKFSKSKKQSEVVLPTERESEVHEEKANTPPSRIEAREEINPAHEALPVDWWGANYNFVRGGRLGSTLHKPNEAMSEPSEDKAASNGRTEFCEQDQENLYKLVEDKATTGKKGLGTGDHTQKIRGACFKGQKKVFGDGDDSKPEREPGTSNGDTKDLGKEDGKPKKRKRDRDGGNEGTVQEGSKIKLKELIAEILTQAPEQRMSVKRLQKRVTAATGLFSNSTEDQLDSFKDKLLKSSRFVVEGKKVTLAVIKSRTG